jgi:hypothetical protein
MCGVGINRAELFEAVLWSDAGLGVSSLVEGLGVSRGGVEAGAGFLG